MNEYRVKHVEEIVQSMISWIAAGGRLTDFTTGSRVRTLVEAVGQEAEELYYQTWAAISEALRTALYDGFQFAPRGARRATGTVTFSRSTPTGQDYTIAAGTRVSTYPTDTDVARRYTVLADTVLATGETSVDATVRAETAGADWNVVAGSVVVLVDSVEGVESVSNAAAVTGGEDAESDESRAARFLEYVSNLQRGTAASIRGAILNNVEDVTGVSVVDSPPLTAHVDDGGVLTDITTEINMPGGDAVDALPAAPAINDALYIGAGRRFNGLYFAMRQIGDGLTAAWEYWNGTAWTAIPDVVDNTGLLSASDLVEWEWDDVSDWRPSTENETWGYWVRLRCTAPGVTTLPEISYAWANPAPGNITVYVHDAAGSLSDEMRESAETQVAAYAAAGVKWSVVEPTPLAVNVTVALTLARGADRETLAETVAGVVTQFLADLAAGRRLSQDALTAAIMNTDPSITDLVWTTPTADVEVSPEQIIRPGTITVS